MKANKFFLFFAVLLFIGTVVNSCKKDTQSTIKTLFTTGTWQLASIQVFHYIGGNQLKTDTLNTTCDTTQLFKFNTDNSCTYTNFDCVTQTPAAGSWSLSRDQLFLYSTVTCKDTIAGGGFGTMQPFANARIVNLGNYSMVLQTGDIATFYTPTTKRTIVQYGFVRQNTHTGK